LFAADALSLSLLIEPTAAQPETFRLRTYALGEEASDRETLLKVEQAASLALLPRHSRWFSVAAAELLLLCGPGGETITALKGHDSPITALAFSRDGTRVATGAEDGTLACWDLSELHLRAR
jgi:hypothetical protein